MRDSPRSARSFRGQTALESRSHQVQPGAERTNPPRTRLCTLCMMKTGPRNQGEHEHEDIDDAAGWRLHYVTFAASCEFTL